MNYQDFKVLEGLSKHYINTPTDDKKIFVPNQFRSVIISLAKARTNIHKHHHDPASDFNPLYDELGILGELAFSLLVGEPMDLSITSKGDNYDFFINNVYIDVKASSKLQNSFLYVKEKRLYDSYSYILGKANWSELSVSFCGWAPGFYIRAMNQQHFKNTFELQEEQLFPFDNVQILINRKFCL